MIATLATIAFGMLAAGTTNREAVATSGILIAIFSFLVAFGSQVLIPIYKEHLAARQVDRKLQWDIAEAERVRKTADHDMENKFNVALLKIEELKADIADRDRMIAMQTQSVVDQKEQLKKVTEFLNVVKPGSVPTVAEANLDVPPKPE